MRTILAIAILLLTAPCFASSVGHGIKDLDDEIRATIVKELAKMKRYDDGKGGGGSSIHRGNQIGIGNSREGCNMDVGSVDNSDSRRPAPRRVVTVVTGSIIQQCR
jgi:hypothetical protein